MEVSRAERPARRLQRPGSPRPVIASESWRRSPAARRPRAAQCTFPAYLGCTPCRQATWNAPVNREWEKPWSGASGPRSSGSSMSAQTCHDALRSLSSDACVLTGSWFPSDSHMPAFRPCEAVFGPLPPDNLQLPRPVFPTLRNGPRQQLACISLQPSCRKVGKPGGGLRPILDREIVRIAEEGMVRLRRED
jgi:hypothetical protein